MSIELDKQALLDRQEKLASELAGLGCGLGVLLRPESVQWLTGALVPPQFVVAASIDDQARVTLVLPSRRAESPAVADRVLPYVEKRLSTMCDSSEQRDASIAVLVGTIEETPSGAACERSIAPPALLNSLGVEWSDADPLMFRLRRCKHRDELDLMERANRANEAMYLRAREIIRPGLNELDLYSELQATAVRTLGEPLTYFGQDFRSNARGGAPRDRAAEAGELWILDLGVGFRGYYSDNARTVAVGEPSAEQREAHRRVASIFPMVERTVRPGVSCREVFDRASAMLAGDEPWVFNHHLGHGVGLAPHEAPRLNPNWDDAFEPGDFFTVEPGLYHESLRHGLRLEQNYLVTEDGVRLLTDWPLGL